MYMYSVSGPGNLVKEVNDSVVPARLDSIVPVVGSLPGLVCTPKRGHGRRMAPVPNLGNSS